LKVHKTDWRDMWSAWAQCGLAGVFPLRGRQFSRVGRVQAVNGVSRTAPLDKARWFGEEVRFLRPDARDISSQDIVLFNSLLGLQAVVASETEDKPATVFNDEATQADRIHATLGCVRVIKGL
jgi:hypothetical protein